jgi:hypothetical protein
MSTTSKTFSVFIEDSQGYEHEIEVRVTADFYYDSSYGADADGNRGIGVWFMNDYQIDEIEGKSLKDHEASFVALVEHAVSKKIDDIEFNIND